MFQGSLFVLFTHRIRRWLLLDSFTPACVLLGNRILPLWPSSPFPNSDHYPEFPSIHLSLLPFPYTCNPGAFVLLCYPSYSFFSLEIDTSEVSGSSLTFRSDLCSSQGNSSQSRTQLRRQDSGALEKRPQPPGEQSPIWAALSPAPDLRMSQLSLCFSHHPYRGLQLFPEPHGCYNHIPKKEMYHSLEGVHSTALPRSGYWQQPHG